MLGQNFSSKIWRKKKCKNITRNNLICVKHEEEKTAKEVKMDKFLVFAYKSQYFAQSQNKFARLHNRATGTIRNSELHQSVLQYNTDMFY